jgi:hypothetical protein
MAEQSASVKVGNRIRFMLYMGREVDGVVRAILQADATISPEQIIQPEKPDAPEDVEL